MNRIPSSDLEFPESADDSQDELAAPEVDSASLLFPSTQGHDTASAQTLTGRHVTPTSHARTAQSIPVPSVEEPARTASVQSTSTIPTPPIASTSGRHAAQQTSSEEAESNNIDIPVWNTVTPKHAGSSEPTQLFPSDQNFTQVITSLPEDDGSEHVEETQLFADNGSTRIAYSTAEETQTLQPLKTGSVPPTAFTPLNNENDDEDDDEDSRSSASSKGHTQRKPIIISIVAAIVVIALIVIGVVLWQRNRAASAKSTALSACQSSQSTLQAAYESLGDQINQQKSLASTPSDQVTDPNTVSTLAATLQSATALQEKQNDISASCDASLAQTVLDQAVKRMDSQVSEVQSMTQQLKTDAQAVSDSIAAQQSKSIVDGLNSAIDEAQTVYDESAGLVADEQTRTALQEAITSAKQIASNNNLTQDEADKAKAALTNAVNAVQESQDALAAANEAAVQEDLQQQQLQQQNQQQYSNQYDPSANTYQGTTDTNGNYAGTTDSDTGATTVPETGNDTSGTTDYSNTAQNSVQ